MTLSPCGRGSAAILRAKLRKSHGGKGERIVCSTRLRRLPSPRRRCLGALHTRGEREITVAPCINIELVA